MARIEALTSRLEQARQARQAALAEAETVLQRALEIEFSDDATEDWSEHTADELFKTVGGQVSPLDTEFHDLPYLGPEHVESGTSRILFSDYAIEKSDRNAMPKINQTALRAFRFRIPDPPEQNRIANLLTALLAKHSELRQLQTETEAELAAFTPALLAKAFKGEL